MPEVRGVQREQDGSALIKGSALVLTLLATLAGLLIHHVPTRMLEVNLAGAAVALISTWACARRSAPKNESSAWHWIALAMLIQASGHLIMVAQAFQWVPPSVSQRLVDVLFLLVLGAFLMGLTRWPHGERSQGRRFRTMLDAFIFGGSLLFIFWQLGLRDMVSTSQHLGGVFLILSFVFVCLDFGYWVYLILPSAEWPRGPLAYLGLTLAGACLVNMATMLTGLTGTYFPGHWTDALTIPVLLLPALGAWSHETTELVLSSEGPDPRPGGLQLFLPFLPASLGIGVVVVQLVIARHRLDWQTTGLATLVVTALFLRQFISLRDFERLSQSLESRIRERTKELSHAQDVMVRTERMNAMATLGAGLAHDMKNLIGVVRNYALLVHRDIQEGRPVEMEDLEAIQMASGQAVELANQLMNYGRNEEEHDEPFDLTLRLAQLGAMLQAILPAGVTFILELPNEPMILKENPFHIDQMIVNLVLNARDALPEGGIIRVEARLEEGKDGRRGVCLEVEDNGTGIAPDVKAHLFEPFFTTKPSGHGTGIGLASVKAALRGFGGQIKVVSEAGQGTQFILWLPLA